MKIDRQREEQVLTAAYKFASDWAQAWEQEGLPLASITKPVIDQLQREANAATVARQIEEIVSPTSKASKKRRL